MKDKLTRKKEALERNQEHSKLTTAQKITKLDLRFGAGNGAQHERFNLALKMVQEGKGTIIMGAKAVEMGSEPGKVKYIKKPYQKPKRS
jgi:hypothetical protein